MREINFVMVLIALLASFAVATKPSVILILVDDLGASDVAFNARRLNDGFAAFETPALDSLAMDPGEGVQLTNYWTQMMCGPSRSSLISARFAHNLGNPFAMLQGGSLDPKFKTIGHEFQHRNYSTHFVGKWGIDYPRPSDDVLNDPETTYERYNAKADGFGPLNRGFDEFYGLLSSGHNHFTKEIVKSGWVDWHKWNQTHMLDYPEVDAEVTEYSTHIFSREAIRIIDGWSLDQPGFLHLSYTAPHDPLQAPNEYLNMPDCVGMKNWRRRTFCGMVKAIDRGVGEIVQALERKGLADDTIIFFSSDNGGAPSVGGFNYPFHGQKATIMNGGVRAPAFFHIPKNLLGKVGALEYGNLMHIADVGPTLLGLVDRTSQQQPAGIYPHLGQDIDGVDHTEFIMMPKNQNQETPRKSAVIEFSAFFQHAAYVTADGYKLALGNTGRDTLFEEPMGKYYDNDARTRFVVEELICDVFDRWLGDNWFIYGWVFRFYIDVFVNAYYGDTDNAKMLEYIRYTNFGDTIKITDDNLPTVNWDKYNLGHVRLYNLNQDPFENDNIALENKQLVHELASQLVEQVRNDPGHHLSVQKQFALLAMDLFKYVAAAIIVALIVVILLITQVLKAICGRKTTGKVKKE